MANLFDKNSRIAEYFYMLKKPTQEQIDFAYVLMQRHGMNIPFEKLCDYEFCNNYLDLFSYDPDANEITGFRRVETIVSYLYYDKDQRHLQFKLNLTADEVKFMVEVISRYKFKGDIPRENLQEKDPELAAYTALEDAIYNF